MCLSSQGGRSRGLINVAFLWRLSFVSRRCSVSSVAWVVRAFWLLSRGERSASAFPAPSLASLAWVVLRPWSLRWSYGLSTWSSLSVRDRRVGRRLPPAVFTMPYALLPRAPHYSASVGPLGLVFVRPGRLCALRLVGHPVAFPGRFWPALRSWLTAPLPLFAALGFETRELPAQCRPSVLRPCGLLCSRCGPWGLFSA